MPGYLQWSAETPWALAFGVIGLACVALAVPAWRHRDRPGGAHTAALMVAAAIYSLLYALELQAPTLAQQIIWAKLEYVGIAALPLAWFLFTRSYTGARSRISPWIMAVLYIIPVVTVVLVATNEFHHLFWGTIRLQRASPGDAGVGVYEHNVWYWVHVTYSYLLVLAGGFTLISAVLQYPNRYRWRAVPLLLAALAPWVANALYSFGFRPVGVVNVTALAFSVTAVCVALSVLRFDFLRLSPALLPVAHETLFEQMKDLVLAIDVDQRVVWANEAANRALGHQGGALAGRPVQEFMPEAETIATPAPGDDCRDPIEVTLSVEGAQRVYDIAVTALRLRPTEDVGRLLVMRDITERRKAELDLRASEEKLRQSQRMEAIGRLAGGIAHDFNNLLTVILGYGEMILMCEDGLSESARRDLSHMKRAAEKAQGLTAQILAFSRKQPREVKPVCPDRLVDDVAPLLTRTLGEDIGLALDLTAEDAIVQADPDQLTQVLMNLAVNARDAMPEGGSLSIKTDIVSKAAANLEGSPDMALADNEGPADWWRMRVTDTGSGVDEVLLPHMFEPFFTTKSHDKGTGLGLATVYGIVKQSKGDIAVSSKPGEGTTFAVVLPVSGRQPAEWAYSPPKALAREEAAAQEVVLFEVPAEDAYPVDPAAPVILLVEDEPAVRELAARSLREAGYNVVTAVDGPQALATASDPQMRIDLLLSDIVLPRGLRGDEVAYAIRRERPGTKVLFVSGYPRDSSVYAEHSASDAFYLDKPYTPETLAGKVREILSH